MQKSHLVHILNSFSKKEIREIRKWVHSPAHNQREDVAQLYEYLTNGVQDGQSLHKEKVYARLFSNETFDDARMRQTMYFLMKTIEEYILFQEVTDEEVRIRITLAKAYRKRKLNKAFLKNLKTAESLQEKLPYRNEKFFRNKYLIQEEEYRHISEQKRIAEYNLQEISNALDITYLVDKLRQSCHMLTHQKVYKAEYEIGLVEEVLKYVELKNLIQIPAIAIYYYGYKTLTERENEDHFKNLKSQILNNGSLFPQTEIRDIYLMAINYVIEQLNTGKGSYYRELFDLYRKGFEMEILIENGLVSPPTFRNTVSIGLKLKEYDWIYSFISGHQKFLEEKHRDSNVNYCLAKYYYEKRDFNKAMPYLMQVEYNDILLSLNAKTLLLKMYYEQDEFDVLESLLESIRSYLTRKKVMGYHKTNYKNVIRLTKKLVRINPYDDKQKEKVKAEIENAQPLTERKWLLEKMEELQ